MGIDRERAVAGCVEYDGARALFASNLDRGRGRALRRARQIYIEGDHATGVFRDVRRGDAHRCGVGHVGDVCSCGRTGHAGGFEVAAGDRRDGGRHRRRVDVDVSTMGIDRERAVAGCVEYDGARALFASNLDRGRGRALRRARQIYIEGDHATGVFRDVRRGDAHRCDACSRICLWR